MHSATHSGLNREPNVVPMIDVLLVLLIIFMMATTSTRRALDLQLPESQTSGPSEPPIVLEVRAGPTFAINGAAVASGDLAARLAMVYRDRPRKVIYVRGDPAVRYQDVIGAMDVARGAGVRATGVMLPSTGSGRSP